MRFFKGKSLLKKFTSGVLACSIVLSSMVATAHARDDYDGNTKDVVIGGTGITITIDEDGNVISVRNEAGDIIDQITGDSNEDVSSNSSTSEDNQDVEESNDSEEDSNNSEDESTNDNSDDNLGEDTNDNTDESADENSSNSTDENTDDESDTKNPEENENIVFDKYFSLIDDNVVQTSALFVQASSSRIFTKNTNIISSFDNVYILAFDNIQEARYAYSYYIDKVDFISDLSNAFVLANDEYSSNDSSDDAITTLNNICINDYSGYIALIDTGATGADAYLSVFDDDGQDRNGHGTQMINLIRSKNPDAKILSIKAFEDRTTNTANLYAAIRLAIDSNVSVISLSLAGYDNDNNAIIKDIIQEALDKGIIVIGAAGNYNTSAKYFIPGCIDGVITVGAMYSDKTKLDSSNYDADVYVVANSTSEATALYTGMLTADNIDENITATELEDKNDNPNTSETPSGGYDGKGGSTGTYNDFEVQADPLNGISKFEIDPPIKDLPDYDNTSGTSGTTRFTTTMRQVQVYNSSARMNLEGYALLDVSNPSCDDWLKKLLQATAKKSDTSNLVQSKSDTELLIECIGRYEGDGNGTDSFHANYYRGTVTVDVKVDWEITDNGSTKDIDFTVYANLSSANNWQVEYTTVKGDPIPYKLIYTPSDGGADDDSFFLYDYSGTYPSQVYGGSIGSTDREMAEALVQEVNNMTPAELSGTKYVKITLAIDGGNTTIYYSASEFTSSFKASTLLPNRDEAITVSFTLTIEYATTTEYQIYSRPYSAWQEQNITLNLTKTVTNISNYSANFANLPEYSLDGTTFDLYVLRDGSYQRVYDLDGYPATMRISGNIWTKSSKKLTASITLSAEYADEYIYLEEHLPSTATGFKQPTGMFKTDRTISAGGSGTIEIENEPVADPTFLEVSKVNPNTPDKSYVADIDFSGIKYILSYFGDNKANAYSNTSAKDTWTFATNSFGEINFANKSQKVSGSDLYTIDGFVNYPIGWYRIQEDQSAANITKVNNKGLKVSPDVYYVHVIGEDNVKVYKNNETNEYSEIKDGHEAEIPEEELWKPFSFNKKDIYTNSTPQGDATFIGAVYTVYSGKSDRFPSLSSGKTISYKHTNGVTYYYAIGTNNVVYYGTTSSNLVPMTITTNASGYGICPAPLPKADGANRFYIKETTAPSGYKLADNIYYIDYSSETIVYASPNFSVNSETCNNAENGIAYETPRKGSIEIIKSDDTTDDGKAQGDSTLNGIRFAIVNRSTNPVYYNGNTIAVGQVVTIITTYTNGTAMADMLPYGTYQVYELGKGYTIKVGDAYPTNSTAASL